MKETDDALYNFFLKKNLLYLAQSGFHALHSCETALTRLVDMWTANMEKCLLNGIVLLDLRKTFDLVFTDVLLKKLVACQNLWHKACNSWSSSGRYSRSFTVHHFHEWPATPCELITWYVWCWLHIGCDWKNSECSWFVKHFSPRGAQTIYCTLVSVGDVRMTFQYLSLSICALPTSLVDLNSGSVSLFSC